MSQMGVVLTHERCLALGKGDAIGVDDRHRWVVDAVAQNSEGHLRFTFLYGDKKRTVFYKLTPRGYWRFFYESGAVSGVLNASAAMVFTPQEARA
jgi:hypothetical protein